MKIAKAAHDVGIHDGCGDTHGCSGAGAGWSGLRHCDCLITQTKFGLAVVKLLVGVHDNDTLRGPRGYSPAESVATLPLCVSAVPSSAATVAVVDLGAGTFVFKQAATGHIRTRAEGNNEWLRCGCPRTRSEGMAMLEAKFKLLGTHAGGAAVLVVDVLPTQAPD